MSKSKRFGSVAAYNVNAQFEWTKRQVHNVHLQRFYGSLRKLGTSLRPPLSRVEIWRCAYYYRFRLTGALRFLWEWTH